jgi:hypothetical protein
MTINKMTKKWEGPSNSEQYLANRSTVPQVSALMAKSVSEVRRQMLAEDVEAGLFQEGSGSTNYANIGMTSLGVVSSSVGLKKYGQALGNAGGGLFHGSHGNTVKQIPEVYSPLWLNSNLNLPRDRATINAWCRSFFALNPFVHNAICLHSTYPISKLSIKCPNKDIEKFFNDMIEEIDLMNICVQIAQEYWLLGEAFIYAELDEGRGRWNRLMIQNPDYMIVKRSVVANEPVIMLRPDENLKKIIFSNRPTDVEQRKQLNNHIIDSVKRGQNIPLDNFHVSHLARRISPYEIRGTGLPVCIFRQLMLFDKLRECYSTDCEVLTDKGFKTIDQITHLTSNIQINPNYVNGAMLDENGQISSILTMKEDFKVACVNPETNQVEYHTPTELHMSAYKGKMLHFSGKKIDTLVTPNHKMWVKEQTNGKWGEYQKISASELLLKKKYYKFKSNALFTSDENPQIIDVCGFQIPTELYLKVLGYIVSEGCIYENYKNGRYDANVSLNQLTSSDCYIDMRQSFEAFADKLNREAHGYVNIKGSGYSKNTPKEKWESKIAGKDITQYFKREIGTNGSTLSENKHLPRWVLNLSPKLLCVLLKSLTLGDGSEAISKYGTGSQSFKYSTISKQLADDVYELVYKCGYVPNICVSTAEKSDGRTVTEYIVLWSNTDYGNEPLVYTGQKSSNNNGGGAIIEEVDYNGVVWCFEVPTGLFITRRNGKITIQGNSKFAQADNMINPTTLVKIGGAGQDGFKPTFADIEAYREIFECHDEDTEVLTKDGFRKFHEVMNYQEVMDGTTGMSHITYAVPRTGIEIACFNPINEQLEYHQPTGASLYNYDGEMYHFANEKMDIKVTPNHKMWIQKKEYEYHGHRSLRKTKWGEWKKTEAQNINLKDYSRFRSQVNWIGKDDIQFVDVCGKQIPVELYLEFLGYLVSEGCLYRDKKNNNHNMVALYQSTKKYHEIFDTCMSKLAKHLDKSYKSIIRERDNPNWTDMWIGIFRDKDIYDHFRDEVGNDKGETKAPFKCLPRWVLDLSPRLLNILLKAAVLGDGSIYDNPKKISQRFAYYTTSKQLSDDIYEVIYKCGLVPTIFIRDNDEYIYKNEKVRLPLYTILWSNSGKGEFPLVYKTSRNSQTKEKHDLLKIEKYNGKVWCFEVPTGLFITRRNGKITIQHNSAQYDKDFKIFTHDGVTVERIGWGQGIYDISGDITQLVKEIYVGLQVPPVMMDGGADTTYANGGVALDVLRQRYMQFRNMMSQWLKRKIFAPISKIQGFYDYSGGEKQLIVPEIDWNHMSLFDAGDYIQSLVALTTGEDAAKRASLHTLYRSMGLEYEDEQRKIRREAIQNAINAKEKAALNAMDLNALRALDDEDEITEVEGDKAQQEAPLPGEQPGGAPPSMPGLDLGPPPSPGGTPPPTPPPEAAPPAGGGEAPAPPPAK